MIFLIDLPKEFVYLNRNISIVKAFIAALASIIAGKILGKLSKKNFSSKQIKNFFKNTKKISSALGIGKNGKTARRIWIIDSGISTLLNEIIKMIFGQ